MGGSTKTQKQTQESSPWGPQQEPLKYAFDEAARLYQKAGPEYYSGNTVAGFAPEQDQAFQLGRQRATAGNQTMRMAEGFNQDVLSGKYSGDPFQGQVFQNIQQRVMPAVNSQFMGSGRYGSGLHADTAARAMTEAFAPYASSMYQQGIDRMGQAANMAPTFAANDYNDLAALEAIGRQRQGLAQNEINDAKARFDYYQDLPYNKLGQFLNNIGGNYGGTVVSTAKVPQPSMFSQVAGAGLSALGTLGPLLSDARAKDDVRRVGAMNDGTAIYAYRYKGSPVTHFGVLAQEVEKTHPHAVVTRADGFKAVDYAALADAVSP
jgi:hypothetical protein